MIKEESKFVTNARSNNKIVFFMDEESGVGGILYLSFGAQRYIDEDDPSDDSEHYFGTSYSLIADAFKTEHCYIVNDLDSSISIKPKTFLNIQDIKKYIFDNIDKAFNREEIEKNLDLTKESLYFLPFLIEDNTLDEILINSGIDSVLKSFEKDDCFDDVFSYVLNKLGKNPKDYIFK